MSAAPEGFEPTLVGLLCSWCSYAGADLAGASRLQVPANLKVVRVMCSARVEPSLVLEALSRGADGVLVCGCHPGDCHYGSGNHKTARRMALLGRLLDGLGVERERVRLEWISAAEGRRFAEVVAQMTARLRELGPSRLKAGLRAADPGER